MKKALPENEVKLFSIVFNIYQIIFVVQFSRFHISVTMPS